jgi:hypothetical protein
MEHLLNKKYEKLMQRFFFWLVYMSPVQKEHVKRKWLDLEEVLSG